MKVVLIGFMGTGKSALGRILASRLDYRFIDTDSLIESKEQRRIADIFRTDGEAYFRKIETRTAQELSTEDGIVIATGGGFPLNPANIEALRKNSLIVLLTATVEVIYGRIKAERHRPLLDFPDPLARIGQLLASRADVYRNYDMVIDTSYRDLADMAEEIYSELTKRG